ncbi:YhhN-like protein [Kipferlia bialata]|uniref:YhhN-like protein n=1 Tax=Kipferlia bialata TaxID=797122 RepID=A0A391NZZ2_9EUKA|nr:YhhN-like protein [Kipferlia bialata]|eukprot:g16791.t1
MHLVPTERESSPIIPIYVLFLVLMGWRTACVPKATTSDWLLAIGGSVFVCSDYSLGIRVFVLPSLSRVLTTAVYWVAQSFLTAHAVVHRREQER